MDSDISVFSEGEAPVDQPRDPNTRLPNVQLIYNQSTTHSVLGRPLKGRQVIYSPVRQVTRDNVREVVTKALRSHLTNQTEIEYLLNYRLGDQPILRRRKNVREEINNPVVQNHAKEAVDFYKGYVYGEAVQYVRRGDSRADSNLDGKVDSQTINTTSEQISKLNDVLSYYHKAQVDNEMGGWALTCGTSFRFVSTGEEDETLLLSSLDPRYTFVVYSTKIGHPPLCGVHMIQNEDLTRTYYVYTDHAFYELQGDGLSADKLIREEVNYLGQCIIEYPLNEWRTGIFEPAIDILDAINTIQSNRLDGVEQFIQNYIVFLGTKVGPEQINAFKASGVICLPASDNSGGRPDMKVEAPELNQGQTQILMDNLYNRALTIMGIPERSGTGISGGDTGSAVMFRNGWADAEAHARDMETAYRPCDSRFLKIVLKVLANCKNPRERVYVDPRDIETKFTRNKTDNLLTKTQALQTLLASHVDPETAFKTVGLFSDPQQAFMNSKPYLDKAEQLTERQLEGRLRNHEKAATTTAHNQPNPTNENSQKSLNS